MCTVLAADAREPVVEHSTGEERLGDLRDDGPPRAVLARDAVVVHGLQAVQAVPVVRPTAATPPPRPTAIEVRHGCSTRIDIPLERVCDARVASWQEIPDVPSDLSARHDEYLYAEPAQSPARMRRVIGPMRADSGAISQRKRRNAADTRRG